jgi:hypothetical protein
MLANALMNVYEKIADRKLIEKSPTVERVKNLKNGFGDDELKCTLVIKRAKPQDLGEFLWEDWRGIKSGSVAVLTSIAKLFATVQPALLRSSIQSRGWRQ